jgi:hypothetical protein
MKQTKNMREIAAMLDEMSPEQLQLLRIKIEALYRRALIKLVPPGAVRFGKVLREMKIRG